MGQEFDATVINLDRDTERLAHFSAQMAAAEVRFERLPGVLGNNPPPHLRPQFATSQLTPGEIGCYASHLLAMEKVTKPTLICEDAIVLTNPQAFIPALNAALHVLPNDWDLLHLMKPKKASVPLAPLSHGVNLVLHSKVPRGSCAYLISPEGARKLTRPTPRIWTNDDDIKTFWRFNLNIYGINPGLVARSKLKSTIDMVHDRGAKFRHFRTLSLDRFTQGVPMNIRRMGFRPWLVCQFKNLVGAR